MKTHFETLLEKIKADPEIISRMKVNFDSELKHLGIPFSQEEINQIKKVASEYQGKGKEEIIRSLSARETAIEKL